MIRVLLCISRIALSKEIHRSQGGDDKAVDGEGGQCRAVQEIQEPIDRCVGHGEGDEEADGDHVEVVVRQDVHVFQQVVEAGGQHNRHSHDKGKVCRRLAAYAEEEAAGDGRARAGKARPQGEDLKQADAEGLGDGELVHVIAQRFSMGFFSCHHEYAAGNEADEDRFYGKQIGLDEVMEQIPYGQDGDCAGSDVNQRQARIGTPPVFPLQQGPPAVEMQHSQDFFFVYDRHGHDSPQLDKDFEYAGLPAVIAQQMADENHMACRRYGQEFRRPFDDT